TGSSCPISTSTAPSSSTFVEKILITAAHVTFYELNIDLSQWRVVTRKHRSAVFESGSEENRYHENENENEDEEVDEARSP
ncbi:hypothetical protein S245_005268, partial [Arachis hypogaea]